MRVGASAGILSAAKDLARSFAALGTTAAEATAAHSIFAKHASVTSLTQLGAALLDFALPRMCVGCEGALHAGDSGLVCGRCWSRLHMLPRPQCTRCGHPSRRMPSGAIASCAWCELLPPFVRAVRSVCWVPDGPAAAIVHALKYGGWWRAADGMGERMARLAFPGDVTRERAALVPVPLAADRLRERGYNQSALLAGVVSRRWGVPVMHDALVRGRATETQTRLTPGDRAANVRGAFRATAGTHSTSVRGLHVVLVDDVVTTAATLNACATALFESGARIVSYVTFARARAAGDPG